MMKRLTNYACLISLVGMTAVVLPNASLADCTAKDLQGWEQKAAGAILAYKAKQKEKNEYVKTHAAMGPAYKTLEKEEADKLAGVQKVHDDMKAKGCLTKSKLQWPAGVRG